MTTDPNCGPASELWKVAQHWVVKLRSGDVGSDDLDALEAWKNRSAAHLKAFSEASFQWEMLRRAATSLQERTGARGNEQSGKRAQLLLSRRTWLGGAMAASAAGGVFLAAHPPFELWPSLAELGSDVRTGVGERRELALSSAASIELNTRTNSSSRATRRRRDKSR